MTLLQPDLTIRPITGPDELDLFCRLPYQLDPELSGDLDTLRRRPEWMWLALRDGRPVARAAWWARPGDPTPLLLDVFDLDDAVPDRVDIGVQLVQTALAALLPAGGTPPEYGRYVPPGWRDDPATRRAVEDRMAALARLGARPLVERLRLEWRPGTPIAPPSGRLSFRPVADRAELVALMTSVLDGTLDAHSLAELASMPAAQAASEHYDGEFARFSSPRDWWRVATSPDGGSVGFVVPAHNGYNPIIAYLGVLPAHRGRGHIDDILAEGTRILAGQDVPRIRASTDVGNRPMAAAFARAGYVTFEQEVTMVWS